MSSLFCILLNKILHDISVKKVVTLISSCLNILVSLATGLLTYDVLWIHKNKVHVASVFVLVAHF